MKKSRPSESGGNWMDTYGDMVTLLLCFFVMLYSMSNLDAAKWDIFVRSIGGFTEESVENLTVNGDIKAEEGSGIPPKTAELFDESEENVLETLYLAIAVALQEAGIEGVTTSRGEGYTYVEFQDKAFFNGDSAVLTPQGKVTLEAFGQSIATVSEQLEQIDIMAHTAQGEPTKPNNPRTDRMLSAMRAAEVCIFLQNMNIIEPEKLIDISYGQFRPIASNDTREGRVKNRRVELLLIDKGAELKSLDEYYREYTSGLNADRTVNTSNDLSGVPVFAPSEDAGKEIGVSMNGPILNDPEEEAVFVQREGRQAGRPSDDEQALEKSSESPLDEAGEDLPSDAETSEAPFDEAEETMPSDTGESGEPLDTGQE